MRWLRLKIWWWWWKGRQAAEIISDFARDAFGVAWRAGRDYWVREMAKDDPPRPPQNGTGNGKHLEVLEDWECPQVTKKPPPDGGGLNVTRRLD